ncbi:Tripartite ATP-independent transporter, DctQ component [Loktanella atrilutea]|uniref:TRAP transporter small permease protein n=1 Tax=Loktanella atrilutea TaxID=366533 RepID=A0A1M5CLS2_LOKAT|nr:TRAP transporter small permease [Loktanella atrilutea]SHF55678.1 Tripartite ATP-independent transporter, DctQ component [Loktanella atrilutea]
MNDGLPHDGAGPFHDTVRAMAEDIEIRADTGTLPAFATAPIGFALGSVANLFSAIGTIWIGLMMVMIVLDVIGRNFFNAPITGVAEIAGRSVVAIVFLQIAAAVMQGRLTRADFLIRRIGSASPGAARLLDSLFLLVGALVFALILWASWPNTIKAFETSEFFGVQGVFTIPTLPFRAITVLGCAVALLACLYRAAMTWRAPGGAA